MKTIIIILALLITSSVNAFEITEYKGVPVLNEALCHDDSIACIRGAWGSPTIHIAEWEDEQDYMDSVVHEYGHLVHLYNDTAFFIWETIVNLDVSKYGLEPYPKYISSYSTTNIYEDFAENYMIVSRDGFDGKIESHLDLKRLVMKRIIILYDY